jgi:aconitase A
MAAGLLAKKAVTLGLKRQPWVKASLAPGSKVVSDYLAQARLTASLLPAVFRVPVFSRTVSLARPKWPRFSGS